MCDGGCNVRGAWVRHAQPQAVMGTDLSASVRNDVASCIEKRRGEAAVERVTGSELASELFFPSRRTLRGNGEGHPDDVQ
jgi:hypothetical protein